MESVTPLLSRAGVGRVLVMPNLAHPVVTCSQAAAYRQSLQALVGSRAA